MKTQALLLILLLVATTAMAQNKPKAKQKDEMPSQQEMAEMMKEMDKAMSEMSPEDKKALDSMGFQMPDLKGVQNTLSGVSDAQLQAAYEAESRIVPLKDATRIASISKIPLTNTTMGSFVSGTHGKVVLKLKAASKTKGEEIYKIVKGQYNSDVATGNTAMGLWMMGKPELALYVMGKACQDNPNNTDNLNNYAAMLSMTGAEQLAIPMLNYVNRRYPKNSTVLNNLGQAWFGLGEITKANAYLDSTIRIYANHPQANYTKSFVEESKNNKAGAIEAVKRSIKKDHYNGEKDSRLNKLGYKLKGDDLNWNRPMPADPLGLEKFNWPAYPLGVDASPQLEKEWNDFKAKCQQEMAALSAEQKKLEAEMIKANNERTKGLLQAGYKGKMISPFPPLAPKAMVKLKYLIDGKDGQLAFNYQKKAEAVAKAYQLTGELDDQLSQQQEALRKEYEDQFGEGKSNPFGAVCSKENGLLNKFLNASNSALLQANTDFLNFMRKKLNDEAYYNQYTQWPEQFEFSKVQFKLMWLNLIYDQKVMFKNRSTYCQDQSNTKEKPFKLAQFDDVHCMYHSSFSTPVGTIQTDCSRMTTTLDLKVIKLGLKQDMDKENFNDQFMSCSVEVGVGAGAGVSNGPLKAEAYVGGSIAAEFDRTGLSDVAIKVQGGVSAGTDIIDGGSMAGVGVSDLSIDAGVSGKMSLISGKSSMEGTGILSGLSK